MGTGLKRLISKRIPLVPINEFQTSKICCQYHHELKKVKLDEKKVHYLVECQTCGKRNLGCPKDILSRAIAPARQALPLRRMPRRMPLRSGAWRRSEG